jgi:hypothetical protein
VLGVPGRDWTTIDETLRKRRRKLPLGWSLSQLLRENGRFDPRTLSIEMILAWADLHRRCTGKWPGPYAGPIDSAPGEQWGGIDRALKKGLRGLPPGSGLRKLLAGRRLPARAR